MNETGVLRQDNNRGNRGSNVLKKFQYVTRPHANTVVVKAYNPTQLKNRSVLRSNGFACINVTLHIKAFLVEMQLF